MPWIDETELYPNKVILMKISDIHDYIRAIIVKRTAKVRNPVPSDTALPKSNAVKKIEKMLDNFIRKGGYANEARLIADAFGIVLKAKIELPMRATVPQLPFLVCIVPMMNRSGHNYIVGKTYLALKSSTCCDENGLMGNSIGGSQGEYRVASEEETNNFVKAITTSAFESLALQVGNPTVAEETGSELVEDDIDGEVHEANEI